MKKYSYNSVFLLIVAFCFISCFSFIGCDFVILNKQNYESEIDSYQDAISTSQEKELERYYSKNNIRPMSKEYELSEKRLNSRVDIVNHLNEIDPSCQWNSTPTVERDLASKYGTNPINTYEEMNYIQDAKNGIEDWPSTKEFIGCGTIAMIECLNYLAETLHYNSLNKFTSNKVTNVYDTLKLNRTNRSYNVLTETKSTGWWGAGTSIMPSSFVSGANAVLNKYNLHRDSNDYLINVTGDLVSNSKNKQGRIDEIKQYIDNGVVFVMWTGTEFGEFSTHYFNIIGYEDWQGVDANGNVVTKTFIKTNFNWENYENIYMDSELLSRPTMGLIRFELKRRNINIDNSTLEIGSSYNSTEISKMTPTLSRVDYLRAAYINHYSDAAGTNLDGQYVALSPKKKNEGTAYLQMYFSTYVVGMHIDVSWWREKDRYTDSQGELKIQYRDMDTEEWVTICDLLNDFSLSTDLSKPTRLYVTMPFVSNVIRFYAKYNTPTGNSNGGRFILHGLNVFLAF